MLRLRLVQKANIPKGRVYESTKISKEREPPKNKGNFEMANLLLMKTKQKVDVFNKDLNFVKILTIQIISCGILHDNAPPHQPKSHLCYEPLSISKSSRF